MRKLKWMLAVIAIITAIELSQGATITAVNNGPWGTNSTWSCNCQPSNGDNVIIPSGKTVSITAGPVILSGGPVITITINGTLSLNTGGTLLLDNNDVVKIPTGGKITETGILDAVWFAGTPLFVTATISGPATLTNGTQPVTMIFFTGVVEGDVVVLSWATASELDFDYYNIQRSDDGTNFESIAHVKGAGTSNKRIDYEFKDDAIMSGRSYYRIVAVDLDGTAVPFKVIEVTVDKPIELKSITVFPNPVTGRELNTQLNFAPGEGEIAIYNSQGGIVVQQQLTPAREYVFELPAGMANGIYYVIAQTKAGRVQSRLAVK